MNLCKRQQNFYSHRLTKSGKKSERKNVFQLEERHQCKVTEKWRLKNYENCNEATLLQDTDSHKTHINT